MMETRNGRPHLPMNFEQRGIDMAQLSRIH